MITQPKCIRAAAGISIFRHEVATMAKPNTLEETERERKGNKGSVFRKADYLTYAANRVTNLFAANF